MMTSLLRTLALAGLFAAPLSGCPDKKGSAERAGENVDEAVEGAGDKVEEAADEVGDEIEEAGDKLD